MPLRIDTVIPILQAASAAAKSLQSCPTLCDPIDSSPPGFPVHGILQARTLEWIAKLEQSIYVLFKRYEGAIETSNNSQVNGFM